MRSINDLLSMGWSVTAICEALRLDPKQYQEWKDAGHIKEQDESEVGLRGYVSDIDEYYSALSLKIKGRTSEKGRHPTKEETAIMKDLIAMKRDLMRSGISIEDQVRILGKLRPFIEKEHPDKQAEFVPIITEYIGTLVNESRKQEA